MNNVNLFGRLETKPELLGIPGRDVCEFWLAARGPRREHTLHVRVVAMRDLASACTASSVRGTGLSSADTCVLSALPTPIDTSTRFLPGLSTSSMVSPA